MVVALLRRNADNDVGSSDHNRYSRLKDDMAESSGGGSIDNDDTHCNSRGRYFGLGYCGRDRDGAADYCLRSLYRPLFVQPPLASADGDKVPW